MWPNAFHWLFAVFEKLISPRVKDRHPALLFADLSRSSAGDTLISSSKEMLDGLQRVDEQTEIQVALHVAEWHIQKRRS